MPDTVNVPVLGPTPKGGVLAGGLAVVGVAGYLLYKHYTKPKTGAMGTGYGAYGAYGASPTVPPGSYGAYGYGYIPAGYGGFGTGGFGGGGGWYYGPTVPSPTGQYGTPTTNAQWGQLVEQQLGSSGSDAIASAIGKYLAGLPITQTQQTTILEAEAVAGPPPQAGLGGYPPKMHVLGQHNGQGGGGHGGHGGGGGHRTTTITIHRNETLAQAAHSRGWSARFLSEVESMSGLDANSHLHKGQRITIPAGRTNI